MFTRFKAEFESNGDLVFSGEFKHIEQALKLFDKYKKKMPLSGELYSIVYDGDVIIESTHLLSL